MSHYLRTTGCNTWSCCCVSPRCSRFLESLSRVLDSYLPKMSGYDLLKTVYYLCLLGHLPSAPLEKLLQSSTMESFSNTGQTLNSLTHASSFIVCHFFYHSSSLIHLNFLYFSAAPKYLQSQERMFQTLHLCLRLDRPVLPVPLTVPLSVLGDPISRTSSFNLPWLTQSLQRVLEDQTDTVLQEMMVEEDFYFIGKERSIGLT